MVFFAGTLVYFEKEIGILEDEKTNKNMFLYFEVIGLRCIRQIYLYMFLLYRCHVIENIFPGKKTRYHDFKQN